MSVVELMPDALILLCAYLGSLFGHARASH